MAFHDPAPAARNITVEVEKKPKEDKSGLARQMQDVFKLLNDHQLQINQLRRKLDVKPGESLMEAVTRPADDDASEWNWHGMILSYREGQEDLVALLSQSAGKPLTGAMAQAILKAAE